MMDYSLGFLLKKNCLVAILKETSEKQRKEQGVNKQHPMQTLIKSNAIKAIPEKYLI